MRNSWQVLCVLFGCLLLNGLLINGEEAPKCTPNEDQSSGDGGGVTSCKTVDNLEYGSCCGWNFNEGLLKIQCCPKYSNGRFYCDRDYDVKTCTLPTCKAMDKESPKCSVEFYGELPAGIQNVQECCRVKGSGNKKEAAQCCIVTGKGTKCDGDFPETDCEDYKW